MNDNHHTKYTFSKHDRYQSYTNLHPSQQFQLLVNGSSSFLFKIQSMYTQQQPMMIVCEILLKNYERIRIPQQFHKPFLRQLFLIYENASRYFSLSDHKMHNQHKEDKFYESNQQNKTHYNTTFQYEIIMENHSPRVCFYYKHSNNHNIYIQNTSSGMLLLLLKEAFLNIIKFVTEDINKLLGKYGVGVRTLKEKLKNNMLVLKEMRWFKEIISNRKNIQKIQNNQNGSVMEMEIEINNQQNQLNNNKMGVFDEIQVLNEQKLPEQEQITKRGGYFIINKKKFNIKLSHLQSNKFQIKTKILAEKRLSHRKQLGTIYKYEAKIKKQLKLLKYFNNIPLEDTKYFAKYYSLSYKHISEMVNQIQTQQNHINNNNNNDDSKTIITFSTQCTLKRQNKKSQQTIYMDFYEMNLEEYLNNSQSIDIIQIIDLLKKIFKTVQILHRNGIVHRDLKPANFMIQRLGQGHLMTKIIDYGQSTHESFQYSQNQYLGFSVNYGPIECTYQCQEGFNKKQIDLWSLGVITYELVKKRLPYTYSKCFKKDIKTGWPSQLNFCLQLTGRSRLSLIQNILMILATKFMKVRQSDRLDIQSGLDILERILRLARQLTSQTKL